MAVDNSLSVLLSLSGCQGLEWGGWGRGWGGGGGGGALI